LFRITLRLSLALAFAAVLSLAGLTRPRAAYAQATTGTVNEFQPFFPPAPLFVPCAAGGAGEFLELSGSLHILGHFTINDNHTLFKGHFQPQGITGVGTATGDTYHLTGVSQGLNSAQSDGATFELTVIDNANFVGPGTDNNVLVHTISHFTFNNNGELSSSRLNSTVECK